MKDDYSDMLHLPHWISRRHPPMSMHQRAAQFSPFAALTGYDSAVQETARVTEQRRELEEDAMAELDSRLRLLELALETHPQVTVTFFQPDERKSGGTYHTATGRLQHLDSNRRQLLLEGNPPVSLDAITALESPLFCKEVLK